MLCHHDAVLALAALQLLGYSKRELVGKNISILVPQPMSAAHDSYIAAYCATGTEVSLRTLKSAVSMPMLTGVRCAK